MDLSDSFYTLWPNQSPEPPAPGIVRQVAGSRMSSFGGGSALFVSCDMKLHSVLLGGSYEPDQALRVSAGTPRKHASGGLSRCVGITVRGMKPSR